MSFSSWRFKSSLRHQKLFSSILAGPWRPERRTVNSSLRHQNFQICIVWPVEAGAPDRQFLSSAPKFLNLYCLALGGRSAGPSIPLFGTKIFKSVLSGSWRPERRDAGSADRRAATWSFRHQILNFCGRWSGRPYSPDLQAR